MQIIRLEDHIAPSMPKVTVSVSRRRVDILTRLMAATFFSIAVATKVFELSTFVRHELSQGRQLDKLAFYSSIASRVAVILFLSLMATLFIVREKPVRKAAGLKPRLMAIAGTFLMSAMTLFPRVEMGVGRILVSTFLVALGMALSVFTLSHLGRSFSLMAEARRLVTSGPYAIVRHPLYLCEEIAIVGALLQFLSPATLVIFALHLWIQIQRVGNEEAVLKQAFPDYGEYQSRTSFKFLPGVC